ncbi:hypothetical protein QBC42DRAFT_311835 [Cladorrhinum samala]|uniref:Uncharacterized protein n=1 Tax=Cladorrhinum samala TaxID=585594 RepID=A0AAV9HEX8_9PEZI|nr:hypothetical protein QBC42DRAFT_311835 [Cladorrhinum samala]
MPSLNEHDNTCLLVGLGQNPGLGSQGVKPTDTPSDSIASDIELPSKDNGEEILLLIEAYRDEPCSLRNIRRDGLRDCINASRAAFDPRDTKAGSDPAISDGLTTEAGDAVSERPLSPLPNNASSSAAALSGCHHSTDDVQCRCLKDSHLDRANVYYSGIARRINEARASNRSIVEPYPVVEVFGVTIDREYLFRTWWGYKG